MKISIAIHPMTFLLNPIVVSIIEGGCLTPKNLPITSPNSKYPEYPSIEGNK